MGELSGYAFSPLREGDFPLYRGSGDGLAPVLLVTAEETSLGYLKRLEHEYALRAELDVAWAARPIALLRYRGRLTLVLEDPGGEPLDRRLGQSLAISEFLGIAIPVAAALRQVHGATGGASLTGFGIATRVPREHRSPEALDVIAKRAATCG